jgi:hypothetical protein
MSGNHSPQRMEIYTTERHGERRGFFIFSSVPSVSQWLFLQEGNQ